MRIAVGGTDSPGVREAPMNFGEAPRGGRKLRIPTGMVVPSRPGENRNWETRPEYVHVYVGRKALEVK